MKTARMLVVACSAVVLSASAAAAADGIAIVQKITSGTTTTTNQIAVEKTRMRAEVASARGKQTVIFDGNAQVMRMIDDEGKSYSEMTKADVEKLGGQMNAAMQQMQQQMANMPPEQRARIEAMMQGRGAAMAAAAGPRIEYKKVGTDKVGKWTCDKYEGTRNGEKVSELCTVAPSALGFTAADFEVTKQLVEFFSKLMPQAADNMFTIGSASPSGFSGVPVRSVSFRNGQPQTTAETQDITRQNFPDAMFQVPAGYEKREFPAMGGRGRGRGQQQ